MPEMLLSFWAVNLFYDQKKHVEFNVFKWETPNSHWLLVHSLNPGVQIASNSAYNNVPKEK